MSNGGPAFPVPEVVIQNGQIRQADETGMTLRDYFAAAALQGILARAPQQNSMPKMAVAVAATAYAWADKMISARNGNAEADEAPE